MLLLVLISAFGQNDSLLIDTIFVVAQKKETIIHSKNGLNINNLSHFPQVYVKYALPGSQASVSISGMGAKHTGISFNGFEVQNIGTGSIDISNFPLSLFNNAQISFLPASPESGMAGKIDFFNTSAHSSTVNLQTSVGSFGYKEFQTKSFSNLAHMHILSAFSYESADNNFTFRNNYLPRNPIDTVKNAEYIRIGLLNTLTYSTPKLKIFAQNLAFGINRNFPAPISFIGDYREHQLNLGDLFGISLKYKTSELSIRPKVQTFIFQSFWYGKRNKFTAWNKSFQQSVSFSLQAAWEHFTLKFMNRYANFHSMYFNKQTVDIQKYRQNSFLTLNYRKKTLSVAVSVLFANEFGFNYGLKTIFNFKNLNLSFAKSITYPSLYDLYWLPGGNSALKPENAFSLNLAKNFQKNRLQLKAEFFAKYVKNWIMWQPSKFHYWEATNLPFVAGFGSNFSVVASVKNWQIAAWISFVHLQDNTGKYLLFVPSVSTYLEFKRKIGQNSEFAINANYVGPRHFSYASSDKLAGFLTIDLMFRQKILSRAKFLLFLSVQARNLLNTHYELVPARPLPGRNFLLNLNFKF